MNLYARIGLAAAAVVAAALIGISFFNQPNVGPPTETSSPAPSAEAPTGEIPTVLRTHFLGPPKNLRELGAPDRGDFDLSDGFLAYSSDANNPILYAAVSVTDDLIEFTTTVAGVCEDGDVGTYPWTLSRGDSVLTITEGTDDCPLRAELMPGEYLRSDCRTTLATCLGNLEAGTWESHWFEPRPESGGVYHVRHGAMRFTLPDGWAAYEDDPMGYGLTPQSEYETFEISGRGCYDCPGDKDALSILGSPGAATLDCAEDANVPGVGFAATDLVDWLRQHPGLNTTEPEPRTINGLPALALYIEARTDWTGTCDEENPFRAVPLFYRLGGYHWALSVGERYYATLIDLGDGNTVAVMVDTADDADLEAFVAETAPIIDSLEFPSR